MSTVGNSIVVVNENGERLRANIACWSPPPVPPYTVENNPVGPYFRGGPQGPPGYEGEPGADEDYLFFNTLEGPALVRVTMAGYEGQDIEKRCPFDLVVTLKKKAAGPTGPIGPNRAVVKLGGVFGASYYVSPTDPNVDVPAFAAFLEAHGCTFTQGWLIDAWALGERDASGKFLPGQHDGFIPVERLADGRFDLFKWNQAYFDRIRFYTEVMNAHAIWPLLNILELYAWSDRKAGNQFVPDVTKQPYRNNVNGVKWGNPDDRTFGADPENNPDQLPDAWLKAFITKFVNEMLGTTYTFKIGNEMPEKAMHWRILDAIRAAGYTGIVVCNRNEDAPGQYWNMQIGERLDAIEFHGKLNMGYLDEEYPEEANAGRPTTFREMWQKVEPRNVILSSDGGGGNPTHLPNLREVAIDALKRGASYEHQLALKRNLFFGDGSLRMSDLDIDSAFLLSLIPHKK